MSYMKSKMEELEKYLPPLTRQDDFERFWQETLSELATIPLNSKRSPYPFPSPYITAYTITVSGFYGQTLQGLYIVPTFLKQEKYPCIVHYHGFGGNAGFPHDYLDWAMLGVASLALDVRGQNGKTGDDEPYTAPYGTHKIKGLLNQYECYTRRLYADAVRAIDCALAQPETDPTKLIVMGGSQGGALTMAAASLDHRMIAAIADVPSNSDVIARIEGEHGSFASIAEYLRQHPLDADQAINVQTYFDTMNMAHWVTCPVYASVGLKDTVCPAKCFFATYNRLTVPKKIELYPFNGHDGGGGTHHERKMWYVAGLLGL